MSTISTPSLITAAILLAATATAQSTERVSVDSAGVEGNGGSLSAMAVSADGRYVVFGSQANNLVPGDTNGRKDTFIRDRQTGQTRRVSVDSAGLQGNGDSQDDVSISADGRFVAFSSLASNLVAGDNNGAMDVFVHDNQTGQTTRCSLDASGLEGNGHSDFPALSATGRNVTFASLATNLVPGDTNNVMDVFVHDLLTGQTSRVSIDSAGAQANAASDGVDEGPGISADGRIVSFQSGASNLVPGDTNGVADAFVHDRQTGQTRRVSVRSDGTQGNAIGFRPVISGNGRIVVFSSSASNLVRFDTNFTYDIFAHDLQTGITSMCSVSTAGLPGDRGSDYSTISADGNIVVFESSATNLVPGYGGYLDHDIYVRDRVSGQTSIASVNSAGGRGGGPSMNPAISANGRFVAFSSYGTHLVPSDTNYEPDAFVRDRGANLSLARTGGCPGPVRLTIKNSTSAGWVALVYGSMGTSVKVGPPCQGIMLSLSAPALLRFLLADTAGMVDFVTNVDAAHCGLTLQAVDVAACIASNTVVL